MAQSADADSSAMVIQIIFTEELNPVSANGGIRKMSKKNRKGQQE